LLETTIAGSLPKPEWLAETEKRWPAWRLEGEDLKHAQERSAVEWLKHQTEAGIDIVTNGEQFRTHFVHGFLEHIAGIDWNKKTPWESATTATPSRCRRSPAPFAAPIPFIWTKSVSPGHKPTAN
jgi:methionine synthase II (cobalamin-independent)